MEKGLKKGIILITGGGSGIGRAIAVRLAQDGYDIGIIGRRISGLRKTAKLIRKFGGSVVYKKVDIREKKQVWKAIRYISSCLGKLKGVVAASGIGGPNRPRGRDRWDNIIKTNLYGTYHTLSTAIEFMDNNNEPKQAIAISSLLARVGVRDYTAYCASKAGILGLVRALAVDVAERKIRVNAICPGWVDTKMSRKGLRRLASINNQTFEEAKKTALDAVPLKRMSSPDEIAALVSYLFGEGIEGYTGQSIDISNGSWMM